MIVKSVAVDSNRIMYCPGYQDGRIEKIFLKKNQQLVFVCEECEGMWLSLGDILDDSKGENFMSYLEERGFIREGKKIVWTDLLEEQGVVTLKDVQEYIDKYEIEIVKLE